MDADALPDILHDLAGCAHASFLLESSALEAIVKACPGSSLLRRICCRFDTRHRRDVKSTHVDAE